MTFFFIDTLDKKSNLLRLQNKKYYIPSSDLYRLQGKYVVIMVYPAVLRISVLLCPFDNYSSPRSL